MGTGAIIEVRHRAVDHLVEHLLPSPDVNDWRCVAVIEINDDYRAYEGNE